MHRTILVAAAAGLGAIVAVAGCLWVFSVPLPFGVEVSVREGVSEGYVLIAPYHGGDMYDMPGSVILLDAYGREVHRWVTRYPVLTAYLQPDGRLFAAMTPPIMHSKYPGGGGSTGLIHELDWDGKVIWEYEDPFMTHDFEILPDGSVAYIRWHRSEPGFARAVRGGKATGSADVWTNEVVVVNREKEITWTWRPDDHLDPAAFTLDPSVPRTDWSHMNSIRYTDADPISQRPAFLISARHLDAVFMIDAQDGRIIWRSPEGMMATQHDASFVDDGNVLVFDNGYLKETRLPVIMSRVIEIDPKTDAVVWKFPSDESLVERVRFADSLMSGAQRLNNGNTLITQSVAGRIMEVTPALDIVWSYENEFVTEDGPGIMFKSRKYDPADTEWSDDVKRYRFPVLFWRPSAASF